MDSMRFVAASAAILLVLALMPFSHASYILTAINTTVSLNQNTSAQVVEILRVSITNTSVAQYSTDRLALNFTLSQWQNIIGSSLIEHIVNPHGSIYDFNFLPGPIVSSTNGKVADLVMSYSVTNVTTVNQTGPRTFVYKFNDDVFNYQNAASGDVLGQNTTLTVTLPQGAKVDDVLPIPDYPSFGFAKSYRNVTELSWDSDEPLSKFVLTYTVTESLQDEVLGFFEHVYSYLGGFAYVIVILAVAALIIYTYLRTR